MEDDDYEAITKKPLKLALNDKGKVKKSKHTIKRGKGPTGSATNETKVIVTTTTKAEEAFRRKQEKIAEERIMKKASKTHKQRVEEFNKHLDSLSEHYDIPKVSWTK